MLTAESLAGTAVKEEPYPAIWIPCWCVRPQVAKDVRDPLWRRLFKAADSETGVFSELGGANRVSTMPASLPASKFVVLFAALPHPHADSVPVEIPADVCDEDPDGSVGLPLGSSDGEQGPDKDVGDACRTCGRLRCGSAARSAGVAAWHAAGDGLTSDDHGFDPPDAGAGVLRWLFKEDLDDAKREDTVATSSTRSAFGDEAVNESTRCTCWHGEGIGPESPDDSNGVSDEETPP